MRCQETIPGRAVALLIALAALSCASPAFCDPINDAARTGDVAEVTRLLTSEPRLVFSRDKLDGRTPLHWAAIKGHKDIAELLLANKADVDAKTNGFGTAGGDTPLHFAALGGHKDVAELLLDHGADVNAKNSKGQTPLLIVLFSHRDVAKLLRQRGGRTF
jgi:ankyrin repeat protein